MIDIIIATAAVLYVWFSLIRYEIWFIKYADIHVLLVKEDIKEKSLSMTLI
jgi:hypothetical protein